MKSSLSLILRVLLVAAGVGLAGTRMAAGTPPFIGNVPPGTTLLCTPCGPASFDFNGIDPEGDPIAYVVQAGPGTIDSMTGFWTWQNIAVADTGLHFLTVRVWKLNIGLAGPSSTATLTIAVSPPDAVTLSSGCSTDVLLTGQMRTVQMGTATACDDNVWSMTQSKGPVAGATCSIDNTGLIAFEATQPALYECRVVVSNGVASDTCPHTFVVHGGPGCCSGMRGNVDGVGMVDLSDLSRLISYMYNALTSLPCMDEANVSGTGIVDLTDLSILIKYLTMPGSITIADCP